MAHTASDKALRDQLAAYLTQGHAHMSLDDAVKDFPLERINDQAPNSEYTPWRLLEHIRISQHDILEFVRDPKYNDTYKDMKWPNDYWPKDGDKGTPAAWKKSIQQYNTDLYDFIAVVKDPTVDLYRKIPWGTGQTILKESFVIIDHNSYHIGEFAILRDVMKTWKK